ncbi:PIN domain-containing protein [Nocardia camponoti]|uniref:PIN domain-containing protein n=1 Tax=Nocardia camponoti TaxID=1616106 RepID=UPI003570F93E
MCALAEADLIQPLWSTHILEESRRNLCRRHVDERATASVDRLITTLQTFFPDSMVDGYSQLIDRMENDPKDRHVLAAALQGNADVLHNLQCQGFSCSAHWRGLS